MNNKILILLITTIGIALIVFGWFAISDNLANSGSDTVEETEENKEDKENITSPTGEEYGREEIKEYKFTDLESVINNFLKNDNTFPYIEECKFISENNTTSTFTKLDNSSIEKVINKLKSAKTYEKNILGTYNCPEIHFFIGKVENNVKINEDFSLNCGSTDMVVRYGDTGFAFNFEVNDEEELTNFFKTLK